MAAFLFFMNKVRRALEEQRYSRRTCDAYADWVRRYIAYHGRRHPVDLDTEDAKAFVLAPEEVRQILRRLTYPERLVVSLLYGSGLRIQECVSLRIKDVDTERREIVVRAGKGDRDRRVPLAASSLNDVARARRVAREIWERDWRSGTRSTGVGEAFLRKTPTADSEWG